MTDARGSGSGYSCAMRVGVVCVSVVALVALMAGPAQAGQLSLFNNYDPLPGPGIDTHLAYSADAGETNDVLLHEVDLARIPGLPSPGKVSALGVRDTGNRIRPDRTSSPYNYTEKNCVFLVSDAACVLGPGLIHPPLLTHGLAAVTIELGDQNDRASVTLRERSFYYALRGGEGNDALSSGWSGMTIAGGPGEDRLIGGPNSDWIQARDGEVDVIDCGAGVDAAEVDTIDVTANCE